MNAPPRNKYGESVSRWLKLSKVFFTPIAIIFISYVAFQSNDVIVMVFANAKIIYLTMAVFGWSLLYIFYPAMLAILTRDWHTHVDFKNAFYIHINRLPARYIPGGIWHTFARFIDFSDLGLNKRQLTGIFVFENILSLATAIIIGAFILLFYQTERISYIILTISMIVSGILILISPWLINRHILKHSNSITIVNYITATSILAIYWLLASSVFALYMYALFDNDVANHFIIYGGTYLFSWGVGYLAFFAPQGIGVFELVASHLVNNEIGIINTVAFIAGFRVIVLFSDILIWGVVRLYSLIRI